MAVFQFGAGSLWGINTSSGTNTPQQFGTVQEVSIEASFNTKELYGSKQFPVAIARGTGKVTGKAKFAQINGDIYNQLFFGANSVSGQVLTANNEAGTVGSSPYTVTVTNSATFATDLGVCYTLTGLPLIKVASAPTTGQYSVSAGVYTFASADTGLGVSISYTYTAASTGKKITITNQALGTTPFFQIYFTTTYNGKQVNVQLPQCTSSKLSLISTKMEDFGVPEFDFAALADASGNVLILSTAE